MSRKKRKQGGANQPLLPKPQKTLPMHWPGNQPPQPQQQQQPPIGPLPPKNYKEQNCLPQSWPENYEKLHKLLRSRSIKELKDTLEKFLRIKTGGYKDAPQDITDAHIEVAKYILQNNYGQKI